MRKHSAVSEEIEVDLTPMLDVIFIMLIFFIVITSFTKESALDAQHPSTKNLATPSASRKINLLFTINDNDQVLIEQREIDTRSVRALLEKNLAENAEVAVIVQAHNASSTATLVAVIDAIKAAGIDKVPISSIDSH